MDYVVDDEWEWYIGELFTRTLSTHNPNLISSVVELAPGYRHKVGHALSKISFCGRFYVVDSDPNAISFICKKYKELLPKATIIGIAKKLNELTNELPKEIDLFISNHCIDDMIISSYVKSLSPEKIFANNIEAQKLLIEQWNLLSKDTNSTNKISKNIIDDFKTFLEKNKIKLVVMSQYKSNEHIQNNNANFITAKVFQELKSLMLVDDKSLQNLLSPPMKNDDERFKDPTLLNNVQNAENWIVGKYIGTKK